MSQVCLSSDTIDVQAVEFAVLTGEHFVFPAPSDAFPHFPDVQLTFSFTAAITLTGELPIVLVQNSHQYHCARTLRC